MPLQLLIDNGEYLLVARDDLPLDHGYMLTGTLLEAQKTLNISVPVNGMFGMTAHPGAMAVANDQTIESVSN